MTIGWDTIRAAVYTWVSTTSGLETIFANGNSPRPTGQYIALGMSIQPIARDWVDIEDSDAPSAGAEVDHKLRGMRQLDLTMQCFGGPQSGSTSAMAVLNLVQTSARLPSVQDALTTAGLGLSTHEAITDISSLLQTSAIESRAATATRFFCASEISETGTYIDSAAISYTL